MQSNHKKEISCKTLITVFNAAREKNIDLNKLLVGLPYDLTYLLNRHERIEWYNWVKIYSNAREYFTPAEFEQMGRDYIKNGSYLLGTLGFNFMFSSNKISRSLSKKLFKMGSNDFSCINGELEYRGKNRVRIKSYLDDEYEFCPEFFYIAKGVWEQAGNQLGHKGFKVELEWIHQGVIFDVSWNKEGILFYIKKWWRWLFNIKKAFLDLTDSHEELLKQYNKLEESKKLLQIQTTQLKTAYEITKFIRRSSDIIETLNTITEALVKNAGFSSAHIKLFKDFDETEINLKVHSGIEYKMVTPIFLPVIINEMEIGEIVVYPDAEKDYDECNEMLKYLTPIINITIHDSLVFKSVVDHRNNLELKVKERTIELEEAQKYKDNFFANISHEFRTPLTLILEPIEQILKLAKVDKVKENARLINRSAKKLNRLVEQLLEIGRIEAGKMVLKTNPKNIVSIMRDMVQSFQSFAEHKGITLKLIYNEDEIIVYLDTDKIDKILSNVVSNALKFTPQRGNVTIEIVKRRDVVEITVSDTGMGIPESETEKIFDRFYQVNSGITREYQGTGIGLSLTKELVELHSGSISVDSEEGKGSVFKIVFPLGKQHLKPEEIISDFNGKKTEVEIYFDSGIESESFIENNSFEELLDSSKYVILIVEDNAELRKYLVGILIDDYRTIEAVDGEDGIKKAFGYIPDLVISDVMMPNIDGYKLCSELKNDIRTSHIPIILLTAKAAIKDKAEGFTSGADDYIPKPFDSALLKIRINNLLEQRARIHEHFKKIGLVDLPSSQADSIDKRFLQKVYDSIIKNISDDSFGVEKLADDIAVHRSLLHKKITALVGVPPIDLIKRIRLNTAAKLLETKSGNISEIALEVGFQNPSHFSECFKKQFGISPSKYHFNFSNHSHK